MNAGEEAPGIRAPLAPEAKAYQEPFVVMMVGSAKLDWMARLMAWTEVERRPRLARRGVL